MSYMKTEVDMEYKKKTYKKSKKKKEKLRENLAHVFIGYMI